MQKKDANEGLASALKPKQPTQQELEQAAAEMLAQQPLMEDPEFARLCSIIIVDLNCKEIHLKTVMYEMVFELREFLSEHVYTCFFTNFYFEHAGLRLNEYTELSDLDLVSNPRIIMKPDKYDERSARTHIKRLVDILEKPPVLTVSNQSAAEEATPVIAPRSRSASHASQQNGQDGLDVPDKDSAADDRKESSELLEQDAKIKKSYEEFYEVIRSHQGEEVLKLTSNENQTASQKVASDVSKLLQGSILKSDLNKLKHLQCIESIEFSGYNPAPDSRKMAGDLLYLVVRTLENPGLEQGITCTVNGFYRNDSVERLLFQPLPSQKGNPCFSYSLAGCLNQLSTAFSKNLQTYLTSILKSEPYFISPIAQPTDSWLATDEKQIKVSNYEGVCQSIQPLYGLDPKQVREWNEEFQVVRNFNTDTYMMRVQKERASIKVYQDFVEAATKGAKAIIEGKLTSLNPNEPVKQHVYVYNHIFFSYAVDTPLSNRDLTSTDQFPSYTQANHDLQGIQQLQGIDVPDLHHLATCLVDYKGHRMICQSIIPGILNNSDLSSLAEYGTVDDKKTIVATPEFHEKMTQVAEALSIKKNMVHDRTAGKTLEICGSIEVKGIRGSDRRKYIVDLQGLVPRDANYQGEDCHTCLVRPELISLYQRAKSMDFASQHIKEFAQKLDAERSATEPKAEEGSELTDEQKKEISRRRQEDNLKKLKEVERLIKEAPKHSFNVNVFKSNVELEMTAQEKEAEEQSVRDLATFILEKAIPNLVQDIKQQEGVPIDSASLKDFFHKRGVNMRYLGKVLANLDEYPKQQENMSIHLLQMLGDYKHVKTLLEREIFLRSAKHIVTRILKEERGDSDLYLASAVAHCLNCILAPLPFIQAMNAGKVKPQDDSVQNMFQFFPEESIPSPRRNSFSASPQQSKVQETKASSQEASSVSAFEKGPAAQTPRSAANPEQMTKKQLKKLKQKQNKQAATSQSVKQGEEGAKSDMSQILFQQNEALVGVADEFKIDDLFTQPVLSTGLYRFLPPSFLNITPREIYEQVKEIARVKFGHELPGEQKKLACLQTVHSKTALLRDLCKCLGVQLVVDQNKKLLLGNKIKPIVACINEAIQQEMTSAAQNKRKKQTQAVQVLTEQQILSEYKYLPFQAKDIGQLFANIKTIKQQHSDVKACLAQANQFHKEGQLDRAFELFSQGINMLLQITGAMNEEVAVCITNIASIQFKFGDFLQAIELQTKAIVLQERLLGIDHPQVGFSYATLSMYYHNCGYFSKGFEFLHRALNILHSSIGEYHPEIASIYLKMGLVYQEIDNMDAALAAYTQHLEQTRQMFGQDHIQTASSHQAIALCQYGRQDFRKALESQEQAHEILKKLLPDSNPIVVASKQQLDLYFKLSVQIEKQKSVISRGIGENRQKVDPRFLKAITEARMRKERAAAAEQTPDEEVVAESSEILEQRKQAAEAFQRYQGLVKKLQNPKNKRDILDVLEYQHMRDRQAEYSRVLIEAMQAQKASQETTDQAAKEKTTDEAK